MGAGTWPELTGAGVSPLRTSPRPAPAGSPYTHPPPTTPRAALGLSAPPPRPGPPTGCFPRDGSPPRLPAKSTVSRTGALRTRALANAASGPAPLAAQPSVPRSKLLLRPRQLAETAADFLRELRPASPAAEADGRPREPIETRNRRNRLTDGPSDQ